MGLFDFFKRRAKQDESEKATEEKADAKTSQISDSADDSDVSDAQLTEASSTNVEAQSEVNDSAAVTSSEAIDQVTSEAVATESVDTQSSISAEANETVVAQPTNSDESTNASMETAAVTEQPQPDSESVVEETNQPVSEPKPEDDSAKADQTEPTEAERYDKGLEKSRLTFGQRLNHLLANFRSVDESFFDDLEETLIGADVGFDMAMKISDELREEVKLKNVKKSTDVQNVVVEKLIELYDQAGTDEHNGLTFAKEGPTVILFVGVNGVGKTTTIGKMANLFKQQGKKVLLAAADTFRAGAIEQLNVWAQRDGVDIVKKPEQSDPSAVVFDALKKAKSENYDILFVDTAGRLQNKTNLMNELAKMKRIITREIPDAPQEVLLVLDATTGQNALNQAKMFKEATDVSGIVLTKLDGTARGGIVLAIRNELHLAVKYVGLGEQVDDLRPFEPSEFVYGLFKGLIDVK
ncbi:signal recognition particle-docking protein FtsY [Lactobacillus sp. LC28-10]|uniref:Signal recognition particle receptor FtsY n=1 Tax=Secundilactobacillus angelensis TaxID=2722706 RepID=A0ABX1KVS7_9LACO|nr:signal recognition particle-docking protein FtsY [Secundilactobacillus angelensis]NLR17719.1 signal recognition particle-docking protein FtsY [Secundilactobacillus angelensis]